MPQALAQTIDARAAGRAEVEAGDLVACRLDPAMTRDTGAADMAGGLATGETRARVAPGEAPGVDPLAGEVRNPTQAPLFRCQPVPDHLPTLVRDGGLVPHLEKRPAASRETPRS